MREEDTQTENSKYVLDFRNRDPRLRPKRRTKTKDETSPEDFRIKGKSEGLVNPLRGPKGTCTVYGETTQTTTTKTISTYIVRFR